eukprot:533316-Alexandrium_andersonii.AAC.1
MKQQHAQGMYFLRCDVRGRTLRDPDWMQEGMEAGDVMEVTGGTRRIRMRNTCLLYTSPSPRD